MTKQRFLLAGLLSCMAATAFAQMPQGTPRQDARDARFERRMDQGERSGSLTPREAERLERRHEHMEKMEDRMAADGKITPQERRRMEHMHDKERQDIAREKHDRQHDFNHDGKNDHPPRPPKPAKN